MIDKESLLNDKEFLKSFKDGIELQSFFRELQARAVSQMLISSPLFRQSKVWIYKAGYFSARAISSVDSKSVNLFILLTSYDYYKRYLKVKQKVRHP
ncbi:hypothetical protein [Sphingobacterium sp. HMA12]|uniref:hypothetical protein n=1 Tax=Sphingobacterium sp. HMA12 TaxID=2050894 RepID=UPI000CE9DFD7|nr:hypothetical protein [Sphingobacterium sp. HMA12]